MLHAYIQTFDVTGNLEKFLKLNMAYGICRVGLCALSSSNQIAATYLQYILNVTVRALPDRHIYDRSVSAVSRRKKHV
jgi:hypothetical protein